MPDPRPFPPGYDPQKDKIELVEYDPAWPKLFLKEKAVLRKAFKKFPGLVIEHFGSTSVPGLAAKPVIDIMVAVKSYELWPQLITPLRALDYYYWGTHEEDMLFIKGIHPLGQKRTHHVHIYEFEGPRWKKELAFRDYLRSHPEEARNYENLKRKLVKVYPFNREAYTKSKNSFIQSILEKISLG
jgi:GrpB-like predicted nucleotidyltransferase (UPF0157 family)